MLRILLKDIGYSRPILAVLRVGFLPNLTSLAFQMREIFEKCIDMRTGGHADKLLCILEEFTS